MGNFYCIPEGCGRILYQRYVSDYLKLVYPNHGTWIFRGKNLTVTNEQVVRQGQSAFCCANVYDVEFTYRTEHINPDLQAPTRWETYRNSSFLGDLDTSYGSGGFLVDNNTPRSPSINSIFFRSTPCDQTLGAYRNYETTGVFYYEITNDINIIKWDFLYTLDNCQYDCRTTVRGIDESGESFEWVKDHFECPEVTRGCRLSDEIRQIDIKKVPYLERIEVRDHGIGYLPIAAPLYTRYEIPNECLNIYNTNTWAAPFVLDTVAAPGFLNPYVFIAQICSDPGCPPPEYNVVCDCECESCPDGSCPVECGDHICCYDITTGKAIKEISINQYCGEEI